MNYKSSFIKGEKMKRLIVSGTLVVATISLFIICREQKNQKNNNSITISGNQKMTRTRTASGLEYEILTEGSGNTPRLGDMVTVHYTGWLNNNGERGQQFDSSYSRNEPFTFKIGIKRVIDGWDEGVMTMKVGEKRRLFIPAKLGYRDQAVGPIPANSNLIFDVELLKVS
jgi:FKBP-type peptidyl-prolyl cis-trans isomerase